MYPSFMMEGQQQRSFYHDSFWAKPRFVSWQPDLPGPLHLEMPVKAFGEAVWEIDLFVACSVELNKGLRFVCRICVCSVGIFRARGTIMDPYWVAPYGVANVMFPSTASGVPA